LPQAAAPVAEQRIPGEHDAVCPAQGDEATVVVEHRLRVGALRVGRRNRRRMRQWEEQEAALESMRRLNELVHALPWQDEVERALYVAEATA
jgi:hypothetical protein